MKFYNIPALTPLLNRKLTKDRNKILTSPSKRDC